jgi:uncharacterized protein YndB with AHSA1/START domain
MDRYVTHATFTLERSYPVPPARVFAAWAAKWDGQWQFQVCDGRFEHGEGGSAPVFEVRPAKVLAFAKGRFAQTRHRFG